MWAGQVAPHLAPQPFPLLCLLPHHFPSPSSSLQEMKLSLWVLLSSSLTTHRHLGLRKWKLCPRLLLSFPSPPTPQPGLPLLLLLATTSPGRSHAEPMGLASPSGLWRVRMDRSTRGCGQSQNSTESNLPLPNPGRKMAATLRLLREGKKMG